jgi:hypothetical protein
MKYFPLPPMKGGMFDRSPPLGDPIQEVYDQTKYAIGSGFNAFMGAPAPENPSVLNQKI